MSHIHLCMIVRDEAAVIERCIESVRPLIDGWTIVDMGSSDATQEIVRRSLSDLPGELHLRPWVDFGHNRTEAIRLAEPRGGYLLIVDADDRLRIRPGLDIRRWKASLTLDAYRLRVEDAGKVYQRIHLLHTRRPWRYEGSVYERAICDGPFSCDLTPHIVYERLGGSSATSRKLERDIELLKAELARRPDHPRTVFYLAQSLRDAGKLEQAIALYRRRGELIGWDEERFYSLYQVARLLERSGAGDDEIVGAYLRAFDERPSRVEPLVRLATFLRKRQRWKTAYFFAQQAIDIPLPQDQLFVEEADYLWRAHDEFAIAAYWVGEFGMSAQACRDLLANKSLPADARSRLEKYLQHSVAQLVEGTEVSVARQRDNACKTIVANSQANVAAVIGPWRGGTSLVTGILGELGAELFGPFFVAGTGYPTYEDAHLRQVCLQCWGEMPEDWGAKGDLALRVRLLQEWLGEKLTEDPSDKKRIIAVKHPLFCLLIDELTAAWTTAAGKPLLIKVERSFESICRSWDREAAAGRAAWWPRPDRDAVVREMIDRREVALATRPHVRVNFDQLREAPEQTIAALASECGLPLTHLDAAVRLVRSSS